MIKLVIINYQKPIDFKVKVHTDLRYKIGSF